MKMGLYIRGAKAGQLCIIVDQDDGVSLVCPSIDYTKQSAVISNYHGKYKKVSSFVVKTFDSEEQAMKFWHVAKTMDSIDRAVLAWDKFQVMA